LTNLSEGIKIVGEEKLKRTAASVEIARRDGREQAGAPVVHGKMASFLKLEETVGQLNFAVSWAMMVDVDERDGAV
jgi:hypothetical protein